MLEKTQHSFLCATDEHSDKVDVSECYRVNLIRLTVDSDVDIRFYHMGNTFTEKSNCCSVKFNSKKT